jgi:rhodanese-related sulfurtransferase
LLLHEDDATSRAGILHGVLEDSMNGVSGVRDLTAEEVARGLAQGEIILVDVREPNETAVERIPGSLLVPLSSFAPEDIPNPEGLPVVFSCRSGNRSVKASQIAQAAGLPYDAHLAGGIIAWKAAGYPTQE